MQITCHAALQLSHKYTFQMKKPYLEIFHYTKKNLLCSEGLWLYFPVHSNHNKRIWLSSLGVQSNFLFKLFFEIKFVYNYYYYQHTVSPLKFSINMLKLKGIQGLSVQIVNESTSQIPISTTEMKNKGSAGPL